MRLQIGDRAPYAPGQVIVDLVRRQRQSGTLKTVDSTLLSRLGVTDSLIPRTLASLRMLGLIDDQDNVTQVMEGFKRGNESEYQDYLSDHIKTVYGEVFDVIDPATATPSEIEDAFRGFEPHGQRSRMVVLFLSLCQEAGLVDEVVRDRASNVGRTAEKKKITVRRKKAMTEPGEGEADEGEKSGGGDPKGTVAPPKGMDPLVAAYFAKLPPSGAVWPASGREKYLTALSSIFDIVYEEDDAS